MGIWVMSELRWHPLLGQPVVVAAHRQDRPQMPADWCPFCPGSGRVPEMYDVHLYPNDFPAFCDPGACDVVLYSPDHRLQPSGLPLSQWEKIVALWTRRSAELHSDPRIKNVTIFENAGEAVGVTMPHPHGQIYGIPFVPPRVERELSCRPDYARILEDELRDGRRIVSKSADFVTFTPFYARFPYEICIYPRREVQTLEGLNPAESAALAAAILQVRKKLDARFGFPMPLMMVVHQFARLYVEFLPLQRSPSKLKYLAAVESSLGFFLQDVLPEQAAAELRAL